jgi:hypothetical protein
VRILALTSLVLALACVFAVTATALGQDDIRTAPTPEFAEDVPPLLPMTTAEPASARTRLSGTGIDELAVVGAAYWLLLGGVALRRYRRTVTDSG